MYNDISFTEGTFYLMELTTLITEIRYTKVPNTFQNKEALLSSIAEKEVRFPSPNVEEKLVLSDNGKNIRLLIGKSRTSFEINQPKTPESAKNTCLGYFDRAQKNLKWENLVRIGVRSFWIKETKLSLEELIEKVKKTFYKTNTIMGNAVDVAVDFTLKEEQDKINFNLGPMSKEQLIAQFLPPATFDVSKIPEVFSFVNYDLYTLGSLHYSKELLENYVTRGLEKSRNTAELAFKILEGDNNG
jgi:hypothetical protein